MELQRDTVCDERNEVHVYRIPHVFDPRRRAFLYLAPSPGARRTRATSSPEESLPFLVPAGPLRDALLDVHGDLFGVRSWRDMQERQKAGEVPDFFPCPRSRRLRPG